MRPRFFIVEQLVGATSMVKLVESFEQEDRMVKVTDKNSQSQGWGDESGGKL
ncbi:hypothetical protein MHB44_07885 [Lysinibacillus sp. FSL H8-0500]|uniref:hypothetical protein n=1 Tax=Lysinibacillus sp. FSL H8-0500 TaxID=2921393 RepID=UPI003100D500